jgi:hypothetical protein
MRIVYVNYTCIIRIIYYAHNICELNEYYMYIMQIFYIADNDMWIIRIFLVDYTYNLLCIHFLWIMWANIIHIKMGIGLRRFYNHNV